jgi:prepilin-type N-terminal cleavage/methylation domain-containing protein
VQQTKGLTIIEIMIALALLGIMVTFIASSLASSFQLTRENRRSLDATANIQRILEDIRGQWRDPKKFDNTCAEVILNKATTSFMTITAKYNELDRLAEPKTPLASISIATTCGGTALVECVVPMKRVTLLAVDSKNASREFARAALDINCPEEPR